MRFMIIVKATKDSEAGVMPAEKLIAEMATYHEELKKAGALLDASGLTPSTKGWRIKYSSRANSRAVSAISEPPYSTRTTASRGSRATSSASARSRYSPSLDSSVTLTL